MVEREFGDKLLHVHQFAVIARVPAQESEEIHHGLGQITFLAISRGDFARLGVVPFEGEDREAEFVAVAFGELAVADGLEQKGKMHELRHRVAPAESFIEEHMQRSRREPFLAADHMTHLHQMVVDNIGEMVGGKVVGTFIKHLVVENVGVDGDFAADKVVDMNFAARLNEEADHILRAVVNEAFHLLGGKRERVAHLSAGRGVILEVRNGGACGLEFLGSVESYVGTAVVEKHLDMLAIDVAALALLIGAVGATFAHTLVDADAEPCERFVDIFLGAGHEPAAVGSTKRSWSVSSMRRIMSPPWARANR